MQMSLGEIRPLRLEDETVFLVAPVRAQGWAFAAHAIVSNDSIQRLAGDLLPSAQAMAAAKATRVKFFRRSSDSLGVGPHGGFPGEGAYERAERESQEAKLRVAILSALSKGENTVGKRVISVTDWRDLLEFFKHDTSIGAVNASPDGAVR
jgi:hypothetical protein